MNKAALVEYVRTMILNSEAVDDNQKVAHFQRVAQGVNYAFDTLLGQLGDTRKDKAFISAYLVKDYYNQPVLESNGYRYVGVSDDVVPVAGGNGIWYVQPSRRNLSQQDVGVNLARSGRPNIALFNSLPVGKVMKETMWRFSNISDNRQIILSDIGDSNTTDIRYVDFGVVRAFSSYEDTDEVVVPMGNMDALIRLVMTWFGERYNDKTTNNQ